MQTCLLNSAFYSLINITPTQHRTMHSRAQYKLHNRKQNIDTEKLLNANYVQACDHIFTTNTLTSSLSI